MRVTLLFLILLITHLSFGQDRRPDNVGGGKPVQKDSVEKPPITAYKFFNTSGDTTFVDTTLTIYKDYKFNYLRKDNFELLPFNNVGQAYNKLGRTAIGEDLIPLFAAQARHYNFMDAKDIYYYDVPTPLTELYYRTVPEQGQNLDAFFTINTSERLNFSIAYKGLRSLGKYQHQLTSTGNFRGTFRYETENGRYAVKTHFVSQDLLNQENGGLDAQAVQQYIDKDPEFDDRSILEVKFENAENILYGKRFYLNHIYRLVNATSNKISLRHILNFSDQKYIFRQDAPATTYFGNSFRQTGIRDRVLLRNVYNEVALIYENSTLGKLAFKAGRTNYNYGYHSVVIQEETNIPYENRLQGGIISAGAEYEKQIGWFRLYGDGMLNVVGDFSGNYLTGGISFNLNEENSFNAEINLNSRAPNFNFLLYQSNYVNYNWVNDFDNVNSQTISARLTSKNLADVEAEISRIGNYAYFTKDEDGFTKPFQFPNDINFIKLKAHRQFNYGKFSLYNTVMFQKVTNGANVFKVPDLVTRNSLFYSDHWFQHALFVQTGFTFKYFSSFDIDGYDPVLAEFYVQNEQEIGGYPTVDFFLNSKIRQTRIFFKLEHLNSLFAGNNNFVAPDYPYRDFLIRFGVVWNFFL